MTFTVVVTRDRQPRSFRWTIRQGVNQSNELGLSRSERDPSHARRAAERVFGPLNWQSAEQIGVDEHNGYVVEAALCETK